MQEALISEILKDIAEDNIIILNGDRASYFILNLLANLLVVSNDGIF